jgi:hypothetical protein
MDLRIGQNHPIRIFQVSDLPVWYEPDSSAASRCKLDVE